MDWFKHITGFQEREYDSVLANLSIVDGRLHSRHTKQTFGVGYLETPSLAELRQRAAPFASGHGRTKVSCIKGDVRRLHGEARNAGALFQVASQFNLLEMVGPSITPEDGVTRYQSDPTQGPACAIAAGAGTIYRNYFAPVDGEAGQREDRQIDCLRDIGYALGNVDGSLWQMRNGYCQVTEDGLAAIDGKLRLLDPEEFDKLRAQLRIGVHWDVEVTDEGAGHRVSQTYCSALPVAYNRVRNPQHWARFAGLVLEAAYEATLLVAMLNRKNHGAPVVYLTRLGGGAFGNDPAWITAAVRRAVALTRDAGLDARIVSFSTPDPGMLALADSDGADA